MIEHGKETTNTKSVPSYANSLPYPSCYVIDKLRITQSRHLLPHSQQTFNITKLLLQIFIGVA